MFGLDDAINAGLQIVNKVIPDPQKQAEIALEVARLKQAGEFKGLEAMLQVDLAQIEVNKAEAQNGNLFVAGWRPMIGWSCAAALAFQYVVTPVVMWLAGIFGWNIPMPPALDAILWELMFGMLGMGALRTFEKIKNVAR